MFFAALLMLAENLTVGEITCRGHLVPFLYTSLMYWQYRQAWQCDSIVRCNVIFRRFAEPLRDSPWLCLHSLNINPCITRRGAAAILIQTAINRSLIPSCLLMHEEYGSIWGNDIRPGISRLDSISGCDEDKLLVFLRIFTLVCVKHKHNVVSGIIRTRRTILISKWSANTPGLSELSHKSHLQGFSKLYSTHLDLFHSVCFSKAKRLFIDIYLSNKAVVSAVSMRCGVCLNPLHAFQFFYSVVFRKGET